MRWDAEVQAAVKRWAPVYGVTIDPALVHAIIQKESSHGTLLVTAEPGNRFSYGPMMVLDSTAKGMGVLMPSSLTNPALGISYGVRYLGGLLKRFPGDVARAVAGYNAGPGNAVRSSTTGKFPNQSYVDKVLGYWNSYKRQVTAAAPVAALVLAGAALLWFAARPRRAA
jgi:soluble lytic murein transglycosylase-like protein